MRNEEKFNHTVSILVQAFLNDELAHRVCGACAVGNIVAAAIGTKPKKINGGLGFDNYVFENGKEVHWGRNIVYKSIDDENSLKQIQATGYTKQELILIEKAFESAPGRPALDGISKEIICDSVWMFNGLMAVVDALAKIHQIDLTVAEKSKALFVK